MLRKIVLTIARFLFFIIYSLKVEGREHLKGEPQVIISNHNHWMDPVAIACAYPIPFYIIAKNQLYKGKFRNWFFSKLMTIPVARDGSDMAALRKSIHVLKDTPLVLFPEGTRNKEFKPMDIKMGALIIANRSKKPILPVSILSTFKFRSKVRVIIHPPIEVHDLLPEKPSNEDYEEAGRKIMKIIYDPVMEWKHDH